MAEVIRDVKAVQGTLAQPVEVQEVALLRIVMRPQDEDAGRRLGADHIVHDPAQRPQLVDVITVGQLVDVATHLVAEHPPLRDPHAGAIGHDRLLEGDLGAVGEAGCHLW